MSLKPTRPISLTGAQVSRALVGAPTTSDELSHRRPYLVWANHENLQTPVPTRGTALIQHGLKEWLGSDGGTQLSAVPLAARAGHDAVRALSQGLRDVLDVCAADNTMPVVVCSDIELATEWISGRIASEHGMVMAVGAPYTGPAGHSRQRGGPTWLPLPLRSGLEASACIWLGAPSQPAALKVPLAEGLLFDARRTTVRSMPQQLHAMQARVLQVAPALLACVFYLDDLDLHGDGGGNLSAGVFAATLRWLQALAPWVAVFMVSHERVTAAQRPAMAVLARQLGTAMLKHRGLRRAGWDRLHLQENAPLPLPSSPRHTQGAA